MPSDTHGGNARETALRLGLESSPAIRLDFSVNLNPLGPSDSVASLLLNADALMRDYPDVDALPAEEALAKAVGLPVERLIVCSGATEAFELMLQALKPESVAWSPPSYSGYQEICAKLDIKDIPVPCKSSGLEFAPDFDALAKSGAGAAFVCTPANPTGQTVEPDRIRALAKAMPGSVVAVDESFMDFVERAGKLSLMRADAPENIVVFKSLTKFHCIAGLRLGYAYGPEKVIAQMKKLRLPWSVNGLAQAAMPLILAEPERARAGVEATTRLRDMLSAGLKAIKGLAPCPSEANFVLCRIEEPVKVETVQRRLLQMGILIRSCARTQGLGPQWMRLAVRPEDEIRQLLEALPYALQDKLPARFPAKKKAKAILVVGTTSDSGKSVTATALCRIFSNMGVSTAPFKAQNMSLNSYVTKEGGEMGRAQVAQATAARVEPHTDMNPVLLKPLGDARSQVIVDGQPVRNASAREYYALKEETGAKARAAFDRLASRFDLVVMEGAGSPTEINLLEDDFVNMRMAEHAQAPAILVADIDRGGVFASIFGTVKLLPLKWRSLIAGIVINKFRGDKTLLDPGIETIERLTGIPVLGVVPFIPSLDIDEEDSLGIKKRSSGSKSLLDIVVIRLPRLSNFTDFAAFESAPGVSVRYLSSAKHFGSPDIVFIPGSKNTIQDMLFLDGSGLGERIKDFRKAGGPVFGICGGYQMLGERIEDPLGVEGDLKEIAGLGLLPVRTVMEGKKELAQVSGTANAPLPFLKGESSNFAGYEIHCGRSSALPGAKGFSEPLKMLSRGGAACDESAGTLSEDGLVFGSYVHGIFDDDGIRAELLAWLCERKGVDPQEILSQTPRAQAQEIEIERLAKTLKESIDFDKVLSWLELPGKEKDGH